MPSISRIEESATLPSPHLPFCIGTQRKPSMKKQGIMVATPRRKATIIELPKITKPMGDVLAQLTAALGVDRRIVASDEQIAEAWQRLPRLIRRIPRELRDEKVVRACIAVASGLFDAAINYIWNAAILELRQKVRRFGLHVVPQILDNSAFDEHSLIDLKDSELLDLCLRLNLITDQDFFFLDQCRSTRNSYSVAHPSGGDIDEDELLSFISRCQKHALSSTQNPRGVDTRQLLDALKASRFNKTQRDEWVDRIRATFDAQRELIIGMLHGIYCDPSAGGEPRGNALSLCQSFNAEFTPSTQSMLVDRHQDYNAKGDKKRFDASRQFFVKLGIVSLLGDAEVHRLVTSASQKLLGVHNDWNNFYNEPPFAERLQEITRDVAVPESAQTALVEAVVTCGVGNRYGVSHAALPSYYAIVKSFSPKEIGIMLSLTRRATIVSERIKSSTRCAKRFAVLVGLLEESNVPTSVRADYMRWEETSQVTIDFGIE